MLPKITELQLAYRNFIVQRYHPGLAKMIKSCVQTEIRPIAKVCGPSGQDVLYEGDSVVVDEYFTIKTVKEEIEEVLKNFKQQLYICGVDVSGYAVLVEATVDKFWCAVRKRLARCKPEEKREGKGENG